ncbi:MAG: glycoside hydrolase family protein, partial [Helicobacteraceae bacterium]|nr:glycoside hydrolase family protein [Helicobacteraceae bacterium]
MSDSELKKCKDQIKRHEGLVLVAYKDSLGFWTIGYGHLCDQLKPIKTITKDGADALFEGDFNAARMDAYLIIADLDELSAARQAVIINMAFNLGYKKLSKFNQTIRAIYDRNFERAAKQMLASLWAKQVGKRA